MESLAKGNYQKRWTFCSYNSINLLRALDIPIPESVLGVHVDDLPAGEPVFPRQLGYIYIFLNCYPPFHDLTNFGEVFYPTLLHTGEYKVACNLIFYPTPYLFNLPYSLNIIGKLVLLTLSLFSKSYSSLQPWYSLPLFTTWYSSPKDLIRNLIHPWLHLKIIYTPGWSRTECAPTASSRSETLRTPREIKSINRMTGHDPH